MPIVIPAFLRYAYPIPTIKLVPYTGPYAEEAGSDYIVLAFKDYHEPMFDLMSLDLDKENARALANEILRVLDSEHKGV